MDPKRCKKTHEILKITPNENIMFNNPNDVIKGITEITIK